MPFHLLLLFHFFSLMDSTQVHCVDLGESFPAHICLQNLASMQPRTSPIKFARSAGHAAVRSACRRCTPATRPQARRAPRRDLKAAPRSSPRSSTASGDETSERRQRASVGKISAKCCSFSAVSAPIFASKYAFCSIFQNLPDSQAEIFEI